MVMYVQVRKNVQHLFPIGLQMQQQQNVSGYLWIACFFLSFLCSENSVFWLNLHFRMDGQISEI